MRVRLSNKTSLTAHRTTEILICLKGGFSMLISSCTVPFQLLSRRVSAAELPLQMAIRVEDSWKERVRAIRPANGTKPLCASHSPTMLRFGNDDGLVAAVAFGWCWRGSNRPTSVFQRY